MTGTIDDADTGKPLFLTPDEVADRLRLSSRTVASWRYTGNGPPFMRLGRRVLYRWQDVDNWLRNQPSFQSNADFQQSRKPAG